MPSSACEVEGGGLSGLPFDSTGTLDSDHKGQLNARYLTRGRPNSACRRTATAVFLRAALAQQPSVTIAITTKIIWPMLSSSSLPTVPLIHIVTRLCCSPRRWAPPDGEAYLPQRETPGVLRRQSNGEKKPASVSLLWSSGCIASSRRPSTSAGSGPRDPVHSESLCHGSAERIRRARSSRDCLAPSSLQAELSPALV